jgi:hypothetical protein
VIAQRTPAITIAGPIAATAAVRGERGASRRSRMRARRTG